MHTDLRFVDLILYSFFLSYLGAQGRTRRRSLVPSMPPLLSDDSSRWIITYRVFADKVIRYNPSLPGQLVHALPVLNHNRIDHHTQPMDHRFIATEDSVHSSLAIVHFSILYIKKCEPATTLWHHHFAGEYLKSRSAMAHIFVNKNWSVKVIQHICLILVGCT